MSQLSHVYRSGEKDTAEFLPGEKKNAQEANMLGNSPMTSLLSKECYLGRLASEAETENKRNYTK